MHFMKSKLLFLSIISIFFYSCSTKQYISTTPNYTPETIDKIFIIKNNESHIIKSGIYPIHEIIESYVKYSEPSIVRIDSLIYQELTKRNIDCQIIEESALKYIDEKYITYQDFWAWDFSMYMHILKINIFTSDHKRIIKVASQGNTAGMHNYPSPEGQVPLLIDLIIEETKK